MVKPENVTLDETMILVARDIAKKIEQELDYPGQIKINVIGNPGRGFCKVRKGLSEGCCSSGC